MSAAITRSPEFERRSPRGFEVGQLRRPRRRRSGCHDAAGARSGARRHLRHALKRTDTLRPQHQRGGNSVDDHARTIVYVGPRSEGRTGASAPVPPRAIADPSGVPPRVARPMRPTALRLAFYIRSEAHAVARAATETVISPPTGATRGRAGLVTTAGAAVLTTRTLPALRQPRCASASWRRCGQGR